MALTSTGIVLSWGDGDDGKLGHSSRADCHYPRIIEVSLKFDINAGTEFKIVQPKTFFSELEF